MIDTVSIMDASVRGKLNIPLTVEAPSVLVSIKQ